MSMLTHINPGGLDPQRQFDAAVITITIGRELLWRSLRSVFAQKFDGTVQIVIGIDKLIGALIPLAQIERECPHNMMVTVLDFGYSFSSRHGGVHRERCGGTLRGVLSFAANSRYVTYLDDDNWMADNHIATLRRAMADHDWAYSLRWFVDSGTQQPLCVDEWESVGPNRGCFLHPNGGWVDPNCLMLDKLKCESALQWWSIPLPTDTRQMTGDRNVFHALKSNYKWAETGLATCYYLLTPSDYMHEPRVKWIRSRVGPEVRITI